MSDYDADLLIVGGGPGGLATALHARRQGLSVIVAEPRDGPIDKACGEGLMPAAVEQLRELGVDLTGHPIRGIRYTRGHRQADALFRRGSGLGVRRTELHAGLSSAVAALGIEVLPHRLGEIEQDEHQVSAGGLTARYLVAADGLHSPIRRQLGLERPYRHPRAPRWGQRQHFAVTPWTDLVEVYWADAGEAYVTPIAPNLVGVALLTSTRASFATQLGAFTELADRLPAHAATTVRGAGPLRQRARRRVHGRVLLVGDAAGYVDALTGEGISLACACARALVQCVQAGAPEQYERAWSSLSRRYRVITETLVWARGRPMLRELIVPAAARAPKIFAGLVDQLAR
jgi:flavin-dependent dehydrogenase